MRSLSDVLPKNDSDTQSMPSIKEELKCFNIGIFLVGIYFALEFGSLQALYPVINKMRIPFITAVLCLVYATVKVVLKRFDLSDSTSKIYAVFCLFLMIYSLWAVEEPEVMWSIFKLFLLYFVYHILIVSSANKFHEFILIIDIWLASMAYTSLHGILQGGLVWSNQWVHDENQFAVMCVTGLPFAFFLFSQKQSAIKKLCYGVCILLYTLGIIFSTSRGGMLSAFIVAVFLWLFSKGKIRKLILILATALILVQFIPQRFYSELKRVSIDAQAGGPGERIYLWKLAFDMFLDHPLLGVGPSNYGKYFPEYDQKAERRDVFGGVNWKGQKYVAHSTPLTFLAETGIIGILLLVVLQVTLYKNWRKVSQLVKAYAEPYSELKIIGLNSNSCIISQLGFWVGSLFLTLTVYPFFWILVPLSSVSRRVSELSIPEKG